MADSFSELISDVFDESDISSWYSEDDIPKGGDGIARIFGALKECSYCIACITEENVDSPWIHFETGAIALKSGFDNVFPVLLRPSVQLHEKSPLKIPQHAATSERDIQNIIKLMQQSSNRQDYKFEERFESAYSKFKKKIYEVASYEDPNISQLLISSNFSKHLKNALSNRECLTNKVFAQLSKIVCQRFSTHLKSIAASEHPKLRLPYTEYPYCLDSLLKDAKISKQAIQVKAVALIDEKEFFWSGRLGLHISQNTPRDSIRVFVFSDSSHMKNNFSLLVRNSEYHKVCAISKAAFSAIAGHHSYDFSIISQGESNVLARYYDSSSEKEVFDALNGQNYAQIEFLTDDIDIDTHVEIIEKIISIAVPITPSTNFEKLAASIFYSIPQEVKTVEMSQYINISEYDKHEEAHAYYKEMIENILFRIQCAKNGKAKLRVLELGAGTGLFTKHLIQLKNADVTAVEIDWECYKRMEYKFSSIDITKILSLNGSTLNILHADSRHYVENRYKFDVICSVFADHHIKPTDKNLYFKEVYKNLADDGVFIVGDEFLADYSDSGDSYNASLRLFHNHIIDLARKDGNDILVRLEEAALKSGLDRVGDFKVSCRIYESLLSNNGLFDFGKIKIGPSEENNIGGVYVYEMSKRSNSK